VFHWVALVCCALGTVVIAFVNVEVGVGSGLFISLSGLLLIVGGAINRDWRALGLGIGHIGVCLLFMLLVNLLLWGPGDAHVPFSIMGALYTIAAAAAALWWGALWGPPRTGTSN
jgi:hypothetical protein